MNETSQGGGQTVLAVPASAATGAAAPSTSTSSTTNGEMPSLGTEFESLGEGLTLSRLLSGDSAAWDFDPLNPNANGAASSQNQYRPWEVDLLSSSSASTTATTAVTSVVKSVPATAAPPPPNVLAPPATRPIHAPTPQFYQPHPHAPHFIDQRLPSFQSQFQEPPPYPHAAPAAPPASTAATTTPYFPPMDHSAAAAATYHHLQPRATPPAYQQARKPLAPPAPITALKSPVPNTTLIDAHPTLTAQLRKKTSVDSTTAEPPNANESAAGQEAAISSTDQGSSASLSVGSSEFSSKATPSPANSTPQAETSNVERTAKGTKKKRKRCGECIGCQRKDNCGDCAPCRNDKSHQICKVRRCERLTEKKPRKVNVSFSKKKIRNGFSERMIDMPFLCIRRSVPEEER